MKKVVIVSACRTAIGAFGGTLKDVPAAELGALVVKEAVSRAGIKPEQVDEVNFGIVLQDTNLFTGTIMDYIRYGRLDA